MSAVGQLPVGVPRTWWCQGCGNYDALPAIEAAIAAIGVPSHLLAVVSGVGCAGKTTNFLPGYAVQAPHGRTLPVAAGIKLANPATTVLVIGGDGDGYAIGIAHLVHAAKRDDDVTYVLLNNETMALTEGQQLPGTDTVFRQLDPLAIAVVAGAGFVARADAADRASTAALIERALRHSGFAIVDVRSRCVVYGRDSNVFGQGEANHDASDVVRAFQRAIRPEARGVLHERPPMPHRPQIPHLQRARERDDLDQILHYMARRGSHADAA